MIIFLIALTALILGYFAYGKFVEKVWGVSETRRTPVHIFNDGIDYVKMPIYKCFLIQFLNIAGLGPVFGAILGAVYGPVCLFWIVLGSIFAGGVHDYLSGMISVRFRGYSITKVTRLLFGKPFETVFMMFFVGLLLILGTVFAINPAMMISNIAHIPLTYCALAIFGYYFLTTLLPVDKIIGRFYPYFAALLILVTIALFIVLVSKTTDFYHGMSFVNLHPKGTPIFPLMFITIACGAISGFHATQSPIISRCLNREKDGRLIFYGSMITEGVIALIWATLGIAFYNTTGGLLNAIDKLGQGGVISEIAVNYLGHIGGFLAVLSIVILAITSGDTAFRSARVTLGNYFKINQKKLSKRLFLSVILVGLGFLLSKTDLKALWLYFGFANQTLAVLVLWTLTAYLRHSKKLAIITLIPAIFMTAVCVTYILTDKIGFGLSIEISRLIGIIVALTCGVNFYLYPKLKNFKFKH